MGKKAKKKPAEEAEKGKEEFQSPSFASHVLMLATGALQHLGFVPDPLTKKEERNLPLARYTIDTLQILKEKTKGNLEEGESKLLDELLYDLRMKFVEVSERKS